MLIKHMTDHSNNMYQLVKKVVSNSPGLMDFIIGLVNSVINLQTWQVKSFKEFKSQNNCYQPCSSSS